MNLIEERAALHNAIMGLYVALILDELKQIRAMVADHG
jgi:hypothetical protein